MLEWFKMARRSCYRRSQGMTEYIIIVAVVAVLSIGIILKFGNQIRNLFVVSSKEIAGEDAEITNTMEDEDTGEKAISDL